MRFEFDATKFSIWFTHGKLADKRRETVCVIDFGREEKGTFVVGSAVCAATDQFCKELGRKLALTRALKSTAVYERFGIDKMKLFRAAAWTCYLNREIPISEKTREAPVA